MASGLGESKGTRGEYGEYGDGGEDGEGGGREGEGERGDGDAEGEGEVDGETGGEGKEFGIEVEELMVKDKASGEVEEVAEGGLGGTGREERHGLAVFFPPLEVFLTTPSRVSSGVFSPFFSSRTCPELSLLLPAFPSREPLPSPIFLSPFFSPRPTSLRDEKEARKTPIMDPLPFLDAIA